MIYSKIGGGLTAHPLPPPLPHKKTQLQISHHKVMLMWEPTPKLTSCIIPWLELSCNITITAPTQNNTITAEAGEFQPKRNASEMTRVRINYLANDDTGEPFNEQYLITNDWIGECVNSFVSNAPFLYLLKISENHKVFLCFQGVDERCIGNIWVKYDDNNAMFWYQTSVARDVTNQIKN